MIGDGRERLAYQPFVAICRRISRARRRRGFTCGHASWPQVVEVLERINRRRRTHGSRRVASLRSDPHITQHGHTLLESPFHRSPRNESNVPPERVEIAEQFDLLHHDLRKVEL